MTASTNPVRRIDITISMRPELEMSHAEIIDKFYDFCMANADMFVFQHEKTGEDNNHIQGRVNIKSRIRTLSFAKKVSASTKIPLQFINCSPTSNPTQNFNYTMKSDSRLSGPYSNRDTSCLQVKDPLTGFELHDWQKWILYDWFDNKKKSEYNPSGRKILFVLDEQGNTGKSSLCKHCAIARQKDVCILPVSGNPTQLTSSIIDAGPFPNYILDLPRCKPQNYQTWIQDILHVIEQLQNGLIVNSMYGKYKRLVMNNPQVVIFSNWFIEQHLSPDRYLYMVCPMEENIESYQQRFSVNNNVLNVPGHLKYNKGEELDDDRNSGRIGAQDVY